MSLEKFKTLEELYKKRTLGSYDNGVERGFLIKRKKSDLGVSSPYIGIDPRRYALFRIRYNCPVFPFNNDVIHCETFHQEASGAIRIAERLISEIAQRVGKFHICECTNLED